MNNKPFLTANWNNLIIITYAVEPHLLKSYLPAGLELDMKDGYAFLSLVAFEFNNTKVKGMKFPFHVNFPEINLRYYVKENNRRGVVFIKEIVPRFIIAKFANVLYNENYVSVPMKYSYINDNGINIRHSIFYDNREYYIKMLAEQDSLMPGNTTIEHYFKEHEWGFGSNKNGKTLLYNVEHPHWKIHKIKSLDHNFDFGKIYGEKWKVLNYLKPYNITFAEGSFIKVFPPELLT